MTLVITQAQVTYTLAEDRFIAIKRRLSALRRSTLSTLQGLCAVHYGPDVPVPDNKTDAIVCIITAEHGPHSYEAYVYQQALRARPRRRRGQYLLPLL